MPTNADDIETIRSRFISEWKAAHGGIPFVFDNEPPLDEPTGIWVRLTVDPGFQRRRSIASATYEQLGRVNLQVVVPDGLGDADGQALADSFSSMFCDWHSDDWRIRFDTPMQSRLNTDGEPMTIRVSIPYTAQH